MSSTRTRSTMLREVMLLRIAGVPSGSCRPRAMRKPITDVSAPLSTMKLIGPAAVDQHLDGQARFDLAGFDVLPADVERRVVIGRRQRQHVRRRVGRGLRLSDLGRLGGRDADRYGREHQPECDDQSAARLRQRLLPSSGPSLSPVRRPSATLIRWVNGRGLPSNLSWRRKGETQPSRRRFPRTRLP